MAIFDCHESRAFHPAERPRLSAITKHPKVTFAEYERQLRSMQFTVQSIQQAYLGTRERAVVVLEGWDTAGKGGIVRRLGWAMDPRSFKVYPVAAPLSHEVGAQFLTSLKCALIFLEQPKEILPTFGDCGVLDSTISACWSGRFPRGGQGHQARRSRATASRRSTRVSRRDCRTTKTRERDSCAFGAHICGPIRLRRSSASCATRRSCGKVA